MKFHSVKKKDGVSQQSDYVPMYERYDSYVSETSRRESLC